MRVVESAHVFELCRVGNTRDASLDTQVCLSQATSFNENLDWAILSVALLDEGDEKRRDARRVRTGRRVGGLKERVLPFGEDAINNHFGEVLGGLSWKRILQWMYGRCGAQRVGYRENIARK